MKITNSIKPQGKLSSSTKRAILKYGEFTCRDAYAMHAEGNGASTVAFSFSVLNGYTNAGDAAINAGRELAATRIA